jgi:hypothetical protein
MFGSLFVVAVYDIRIGGLSGILAASIGVPFPQSSGGESNANFSKFMTFRSLRISIFTTNCVKRFKWPMQISEGEDHPE